MAKRKKRSNQYYTSTNNQKKVEIQPANVVETVGGISIVEDIVVSECEEDIGESDRKLAKPLEKISTEKIEIIPQTYIEDIFDINNIDLSQPKVITNQVIEKNISFITREELLNNLQFRNKLDKIIKDVMFKKSFNDLLDISHFSKMNRVFFIDEYVDEADVLLDEVIVYFKKKLAKIDLAYKDYKTIDSYLESIKTLYGRFKHCEGSEKSLLRAELDTLLKMDKYIKCHFF